MCTSFDRYYFNTQESWILMTTVEPMFESCWQNILQGFAGNVGCGGEGKVGTISGREMKGDVSWVSREGKIHSQKNSVILHDQLCSMEMVSVIKVRKWYFYRIRVRSLPGLVSKNSLMLLRLNGCDSGCWWCITLTLMMLVFSKALTTDMWQQSPW